MFLNPHISKQLVDEHRPPLTYRLWRRLRPVTSPRLEAQA